MDSDAQQELRELRASIDNIDAALVHLLAERFEEHQAGGPFEGSSDDAAV